MEADKPSSVWRRIIIVGAGFGGFQTAQSLAGTEAEVILIDRYPYTTFVPLIYQIAADQLDPAWVAYPLQPQRRCRNLKFLHATVHQIDLADNCVHTSAGPWFYDYLVIATGTQPNYYGIPGAADYARPLKTLPDAIAIRDHLLTCWARARACTDAVERAQWLTFVIVGGGATGVEMAGALAESRRTMSRHALPALADRCHIVLVQAGTRLLPELAPQLGQQAQRYLTRLGVTVHLETSLSAVTPTQAMLSNGEHLDTRTVIWAAGLTALAPAIAPGPKLTGRNQLLVQPTLQLQTHSNVYAIGDVAAWGHPGRSLAGVAPVALQAGVATARNLQRQLRGQRPQPFRYRNKGRLAIIGGYSGVGCIAGIHLGGGVAWLLWLIVHLIYLPGYRRRLFVLWRWLQNYGLGERPHRPQANAPPP